PPPRASLPTRRSSDLENLRSAALHFVLKTAVVRRSYIQLNADLRHLATHPVEHRIGPAASHGVVIQDQGRARFCIAAIRVAGLGDRKSTRLNSSHVKI